MRFLSPILDFIFPPKVETFRFRTLSEKNLSQLTLATTAPFSFINSIYSYKDPLVIEMIWGIKYRKDRQALFLGGFSLHDRLIKLFPKNELIILIPMPISKKRKKERGYNQCEALVDEIVKLDLSKKFYKNTHILKRFKHTSRQTLKNRRERLQDMQSVFSATRIEDFIEKKIIIIDDVTTTGSTLQQAYDTLIGIGYKNVTALTLAH